MSLKKFVGHSRTFSTEAPKNETLRSYPTATKNFWWQSSLSQEVVLPSRNISMKSGNFLVENVWRFLLQLSSL